MGRGARAVGVRVAGELELIVAGGALLMLGVGFWMIWNPLGLVVPGGLVFGLVVAGAIWRMQRGRRV